MDFFWSLIVDLVYYGLGSLIFGQEFSRSNSTLPLGKKVFVALLATLVGVLSCFGLLWLVALLLKRGS